MAGKVKELNQEVIAVRAKMDALVEEVKKVDADIAEFEALYVARLEELEAQYQSKVLTLKANRDRLTSELTWYFDVAEPKATKTQEKVTLISGDVVRKKATTKFEPDKAALLEWARANDNELLKQTVKEDLDWITLKNRLVMQVDIEGNTMALDTLTGEILQGVKVVEVPSKLEVK